jgi:hypothetical protein
MTLRDHGIQIDESRWGEQSTLCPQCSHLRRKKTLRCLYVKRDDNGWTWFCHHCGFSGGVANDGLRLQRQRNTDDFGRAARRRRYGIAR